MQSPLVVLPTLVLAALAFSSAGRSTPLVESGKVKVPGGELYYEANGTGRTVVLLHGGLLDCRMWDDQFDLLVEHFHVIRYDARGHGRSSRIAGDFSRYRDLHALLTALDVRRATLVGLSAGARTAIDFALVHPEMVEALVAASPGISGWTFKDPTLQEHNAQLLKAAEAGDLDGAVEWFLRSWTDGPKRQPGEVDAGVRERIRRMARANFGTNAPGRVEEVNAVPRLGELRAPTLVVLGDLDMADIHDIANLVATNVSGARLVVIPGAAHMVNMEKPSVFDQILLDFLRNPAR